MLRDLSIAEPSQQRVRADVVVIGAGLAGLLIASRLCRQGRHVIVLESGAMTQASDRHPLNKVVQIEQTYRGADEGRFRCLGGTSTRWGGAMLPFLPDDLAWQPASWDTEWPLSIEILTKEFAELEHIFALPKGKFEVESEDILRSSSDEFLLRSAKWPAFRMRNVAHVLRHDLSRSDLEVWLNATAISFQLDESGRVAAVTAVSPNGRELKAEAVYFSIAAGAIESTRLMLLMDLQHQNRIFAPDALLGRYFYDHLSASAATITPINRKALITAFGLRFDARGMRDWRIEPTSSLRRKLALPGAFAHVATLSNGEDAFFALRNFYRRAQSGSVPKLRDLAPIACDLEWLVTAAWWRFAKHRLYPPRRAIFELVLVIEQMPHRENKITLALDKKDINDSPMAQIDWQIREPDLGAFRTLQSALMTYWMNSTFQSFGKLTTTPLDVWHKQMCERGAIFHPGGSNSDG